MIKITMVDGTVVEFKDWHQVHRDFVPRGECQCHCESCCEFDAGPCVVEHLVHDDTVAKWESAA